MATPDELYDASIQIKESGDLQGAADKLAEVLALDPDHVLSHTALAVYQQKLGNIEEALKHARRVTELEPTDSFSFTQLSVICQRCGRIQEAEDAMAKAREIQMRAGH